MSADEPPGGWATDKLTQDPVLAKRDLSTLEGAAQQLEAHRATHTDWAWWYEKHPELVLKEMGDATFHRKVEANYTLMIETVRRAAKS